MKIDFKKMDEKDFVFVNNKLTDKEEKDFSAFLKSRKAAVSKPVTLKAVSQ